MIFFRYILVLVIGGLLFNLAFINACEAKKIKWAWPTTAKRISQVYHSGHHAMDIDGEKGDPIYAAAKGTVIEATRDEGYGKYIVLQHKNGFTTKYAHLRKIKVELGQEVKKRDLIGKEGVTGWSSGYHLHFELMKNGKKLNPLRHKYLRRHLLN